jgi:tetratricopeptide (TPR) repeat protein
MNLKALFTTILVVCSITLINAQSKELLAKSAMMNADEAYANGQYFECIGFLRDAETNLGATNSRIQYLRVKSWMVIAADNDNPQPRECWLNAESDLKLFFKVTPENGYVPEKYDEMVLALIKVKKNIEEVDRLMIEKCDAAIEKDPTNRNAYLQRADARENLKDYQGAIQDFSKCIELEPETAIFYTGRAKAKENLKDYQGAIQDYTKTIELETDPFNYSNRAGAKEKMKDYEGAIQDYTKCIELDPNYGYYYFLRGKIYQNNLKDIQAAKKDFEKAILISDHPQIVVFSNYYLGDKEKAFNSLYTMLKDAGDNVEQQRLIYFILAALYSIDGNQAEAIKSLKNALEKGYQSEYYRIEDDEDFDNIRNSPEFKELINKYKNK